MGRYGALSAGAPRTTKRDTTIRRRLAIVGTCLAILTLGFSEPAIAEPIGDAVEHINSKLTPKPKPTWEDIIAPQVAQVEAQRAEEARKAQEAQEAEQARLAQERAAQAAAVAPKPIVRPPAPSGTCQDWMAQAGIVDPANAYTLIMRESGCRPCIVNGGAIDCSYSGNRAYGIPQSLPGNKMASAGTDWQTNPVTQLRWMQSYVFSRYGSWQNALAHSYKFNWY